MNTDNLRFKSNQVSDIAARFHIELDGLYGSEEVSAFVEWLAEAFLGWDRTHLLLNRQSTINQSDLLRFHWALEDLLRYRPIQHIIGYVDFADVRLAVDGRALVPRPETEQMVQHIVRELPPPRRALDLCTGSGCIAIALSAHFPKCEVVAVDISRDALSLAEANVQQSRTRVRLVEADLLHPSTSSDNLLGEGCFDLVVSNPPYVRQSERTQMRPNVLDYDPALALFVPDNDTLLFYRAIAHLATQRLAVGGHLVVEINEALASPTLSLLAAEGFSGALHHDFRDRPRYIVARKAGQ